MRQEQSLPSISVITCTLNPNLTMFRESLDSIASQNYPKKKIEHIVMDGGSERKVEKLAKKFGCKFIKRNDLQLLAQKRMSIGVSMAKNDLLVIIEPDNVIIGKNWFLQMIKPFVENKKIFCAFSMYNATEKKMPALSRYMALIGAPDPTIYYLKKTEKTPLFEKDYDKGRILSKSKDYTVVKFAEDTLPTLGDNGHMIRTSIYQSVNTDPDTFTHTDIFVDLLKKGFDTYAVVPNKIIHYGHANLLRVVRQRVYYKSYYYDRMRGKRKYLVYNPKSNTDRKNLLKYLFFSLTFLQPLSVSVRGYLMIHDIAWFLHPIICIFMVFGYGYSEVRFLMKRFM